MLSALDPGEGVVKQSFARKVVMVIWVRPNRASRARPGDRRVPKPLLAAASYGDAADSFACFRVPCCSAAG